MEKKYLVIEMQTDAEGAVNSVVYTFDTLPEAESKYHFVLGYAAIGELPMHSAAILRSDGATLASDFYARELPEPEQPDEPLEAVADAAPVDETEEAIPDGNDES